MADKQLNKVTHKRSIKRVNLENGERIVLEEPQPILKLRESPKADRRALAAYVEKRDSDEIMEILALDESPSEVRKRRDRSLNRQEETDDVNRVPEVMESVEVKVAIVPTKPTDIKLIEDDGKEPTIAELLEEEFKNDPPIKVPRKEKDHDYEDIENPDEKIVEVVTVVETKAETPEPIEVVEVVDNIEDEIEENVVVEKSDDITITEANEEESFTAVQIAITAASPEADIEQPRLSAVTEVSEPSSDVTENDQDKVPEIKSSLKSRESSVGPDKRVTFSASTEEREIAAEVERREFEDAMAKEDVHLPSFIAVDKRWSNMRWVLTSFIILVYHLLFGVSSLSVDVMLGPYKYDNTDGVTTHGCERTLCLHLQQWQMLRLRNQLGYFLFPRTFALRALSAYIGHPCSLSRWAKFCLLPTHTYWGLFVACHSFRQHSRVSHFLFKVSLHAQDKNKP